MRLRKDRQDILWRHANENASRKAYSVVRELHNLTSQASFLLLTVIEERATESHPTTMSWSQLVGRNHQYHSV